MSFDALGDLNWVATIVGALVYFFVGAAWYAPPVFGNTWMKSIGWDPGNEPPTMKPADYVKPLIAWIVASIAMGMLAVATATDTVGEGLVLGLVVGIGVATVLIYVTAVFDPTSPDPMTWAAVTGGYHLTGFLILGILHGAFTTVA